MKKCPQCSKTYDDTWAMCIKCSVRLEDGPSVSQNAPTEPSNPVEPKRPRKSFELEVGQYYLNRLGIVSLIIGIAFFIGYSFQYIGPLVKLLIGFGIAAALLGAGKWIEARSEQMKWYGWSLIGGGWALTYFATYATHHIKAVRIIENPNLALILLVFVTSVLMIDLMRYRSQIITSLVFGLAYFTSCIDRVSYFSLAYSALLSFSLLFVIHKMKWTRLMIVTVLAAYLSHLWWIGPEIFLTGKAGAGMTLEMSRFILSAGFLSLCWVLFTLAPFLIQSESKEDEHIQTAATLINAFCYGALMLQEVLKVNPEWKFYVALSLGGISMLAAVYSRFFAKREHLTITHVTLAISFITASFPLRFMDRWVDAAWLIEIPILIFLGLYFNRMLYRAVGWALGCLMTLKAMSLYGLLRPDNEAILIPNYYLTHRSMVSILLVAAFFTASIIYRWFSERNAQAKQEEFARAAFFAIGLFFLLALSADDIHGNLLSIAWMICAFVFFGIGFLMRDKWFRWMALGFVGITIARLVVIDARNLPVPYRIGLFIGMGVSLLGASFFYGKIASIQNKENQNDK